MKALIYRKFGSADELEWTDGWPDPEVSSQCVLIKTVAGSINPKDVLLRKGKFSRTLARKSLPRVSGLDAAGAIVAVGSAVSGFSVGDAVFGMTNEFAGGVHSEIAKQLGRRGIYVSTIPKPATLWAEALAWLGVSMANRLVQVRSRSEDLRRLKDWIEGGLVVPHLEKEYPVSRAADAHRHIESRHTIGKVCSSFQS